MFPPCFHSLSALFPRFGHFEVLNIHFSKRAKVSGRRSNFKIETKFIPKLVVANQCRYLCTNDESYSLFPFVRDSSLHYIFSLRLHFFFRCSKLQPQGTQRVKLCRSLVQTNKQTRDIYNYYKVRPPICPFCPSVRVYWA